MHLRSTRLLILVTLVALVLAACSKPGAQASDVSAERVQAQPTVALKSSGGPAAPDWTLETLDGGTFRLADHRGEVVVMFFMASWCGTCVPEAQALAELYRQYGQEGLTVVAINVEPEKKAPELTRFRQLANNGEYFWTFDTAFQVTQLYNVKALDTTIIIDRTGHIAYRDGFPTPKDVLEPEIQKWL